MPHGIRTCASPLPSANHQLTLPKYRSDIDGLRAIAVVSVVFFHAFPSVVRGGFVGVDIFFVISGYLISTIIFENLRGNKFSFRDFYTRRIRRIFPALLLVLVAALLAGWFLLLPDEYKQLSKHTLGGTTFLSNGVLWREAGYFDSSSETKPLVHLWSLAIEEQFYIFYPFLMWLAWRYRVNVFAGTLLIAFTSFLFNLGTFTSNPIANFYSPQTRFWELMIGCSLAYAAFHKADLPAKTGPAIGRESRLTSGSGESRPASAALSNLQSTLGIVCVVAAVCAVTKSAHFPGLWALLPTLGTALLISAGPDAWINQHILSCRPFVWIGVISYPLYLWHWVFLSFCTIVGNDIPAVHIRVAAVGLSFLFAGLTYRFVERPLRFGKRSARCAPFLAAAMIVVGCAAAVIYARNGIVSRSIVKQAGPLAVYDYRNNKTEEAFWGQSSCFLVSELSDAFKFATFQNNGCDRILHPGKPTIALVGDSHSAYLSQYLRPFVEKKGYNFVQFSASFCVPLSTHTRDRRCADLNKSMIADLLNLRPDVLILFAYHMHWGSADAYKEAEPYDKFIAHRIAEFRGSGIKTILVIGEMPTWAGSLPRSIVRKFVLRGKGIPLRTFEGVTPESLEWDDRLRRGVQDEDGVHYLSLRKLLCNSDGCLTRVGPDISTDLVVFDYGHLTNSGARVVTEQLLAPYLEVENKPDLRPRN